MNYRKVLGMLEQERLLLLKEEEKEDNDQEVEDKKEVVSVSGAQSSEMGDNQSESTKK